MTDFNDKIVDIEQWGRLLKHPDFQAFEKHLEEKLKALRYQVESKYSEPSANRAYELIDLVARIDELKRLFSRIDFKKHEYRQFEQEKK